MTRRGPLRDYDVGYGRPPKQARFKKGRSGNPSGRPRRPKSRTLRNYWADRFERKIRLGDGRLVTTLHALGEVWLNRALKGDRFAMKLLCDLTDKFHHDFRDDRARMCPDDPHVKSSRTMLDLLMKDFVDLDQKG